MNLAERILARASGRASVTPGEIVVAAVDRLVMHDLSGYLTAEVFDALPGGTIKHPERVVMVFDHHFSPPTERQAVVLQRNREWARRHGIRLFDCGSGNLHHVLVRRGLVEPGMVVVGSDSHTPVHGTVGALAVALGNDSHAATVLPHGTAWFKVPHTVRVELDGTPPPGTCPRDIALWLVGRIGEGELNYAAVEFAGGYVRELGFWDRWLFPLLCVDLGAKCGYVEPDGGGVPAEVLRFDVSEVEPQLACPPTVGNVKPVRAAAGTPVSWAELGGHGGGRLADIRAAASMLAGRTVHPEVRFNIVPSSREVFAEAAREGLVLALHEAGATWFPPSTGSNQAYNMGALAPDESMISTHSRNFPGRNGSPHAAMYLASAASVAAAAITGVVTDPADLTRRRA